MTGFEYPDSPLQIRQEFQRHLPFILDLAHSADDPANPRSHLETRRRTLTSTRLRSPSAIRSRSARA